MSALPSSRKTHSQKHEQIFRQLLKELPNKSCVDCKSAQHPRWASWNLGCFICIRCSGIHRSMGTHVSRVKSVDLDVWTDEQVELMIKWGNEKCNLFWEAKLPANYVPDASKIANFIRTKYDMRKWAALTCVPDPMTLAGGASVDINTSTLGNTSINNTVPGTVIRSSSAAGRPQTTSAQNMHVAASAPSILNDDFGAFTSSTLDLSIDVPAHKLHRSAITFPTNTSGKAPHSSHILTPATPLAVSPRVADVRTDLKKSILSLYSSPSSSSSSVHQQPQPHQQSPGFKNPAITSSPNASVRRLAAQALANLQGNMQPNMHGLSSSLLGLNFGNEPLVSSGATLQNSSTPAFVPSPLPLVPLESSMKQSTSFGASSQWANEWNDSSKSVNQWGNGPAYNGGGGTSVLDERYMGTFGSGASSISSSVNLASLKKATTAADLDEDLFKNVWG